MRAQPELVGGYFKLKWKDFVLFRKKMVENSEVHRAKAVQRGQNQEQEPAGLQESVSQCSGGSMVDTGTWNNQCRLSRLV